MTPAPRRAVELFFLGAVPVVALALALAAYAGDDRLALDFHHEVYRQADAVVHGERAYDAPDADLSDRANFLVVLERSDALTWLSLRNAPEVHIVAVDQLNTYDVLAADDIVFSKGAYDAFVSGTAKEVSK